MYSLFIGLTLGGVPLIWSMIGEAHRDRQANVRASVAGGVIGIAAMAIMVLFKTGGGDSSNFALLIVAGLAGASAMILPGLSGGYLLLVLGQYVPILASIDRLKDAVGARDVGAIGAEWVVVVPVGLGVVIGIAGVSNLVRFMLKRFEGFTLGVLMGLLLGSVLGLWPFQQGVQPAIGSTLKGEVVTEQSLQTIAREDWPLAFFAPTVMQVVWAVVLVGTGLAITLGIAAVGNRLKRD